jgi:Sec-independent protein translocase protein TatA
MGRSLHGARGGVQASRRRGRTRGRGAYARLAGPAMVRPVFGLGMMEIGLIIALAVMLFPPKELPKLARSIAKIYGQVRKTAEDFRNTVLEDEDLREPIDEIKGAYNEARFEVRDAERKARQQLAKAQMELRMATARRIQAEKEAKANAELGEGSGDAEDSSAGSASEPTRAANSPALASPRVEPASLDDDPRAPVAGADPRVIAARRSGAYTPRVAVDDPESDDDRDDRDDQDDQVHQDARDDEQREGVA